MFIYLYNGPGRQCAGDNDGIERHGARYTDGLVDDALYTTAIAAVTSSPCAVKNCITQNM